jgi:hypothetical protein
MSPWIVIVPLVLVVAGMGLLWLVLAIFTRGGGRRGRGRDAE